MRIVHESSNFTFIEHEGSYTLTTVTGETVSLPAQVGMGLATRIDSVNERYRVTAGRLAWKDLKCQEALSQAIIKKIA